MPKVPAISVVIPVFDEAGNIAGLVQEISAALSDISHEILCVDDASRDDTLTVLKDLKKDYTQLRVLSHRQNSGQSRALRTGILAAHSPVIVTLDGDGQNDPADIPGLYDHFSRKDRPENLGLVGGRRVKRQDNMGKKLASKIGNSVRRQLLKDEADDTGCGLKLFDRAAFLRLPYFDHIHRYLPALMLREGYACEYRDVNHRSRQHGVSKYTNFGRLIVSLSDLLGVIWLRRRARNPQGWDEL